MSAEPRLALEGLGVRAGGREILAGVSFELQAGEVLALAGPNGAGKTTLVRACTRVVSRSAGRVRVGGRELSTLSRRELAREIAVVPQEVAIAFPFTAAEVVLMGRVPHLAGLGFETRADVERAREAMEQVGVAGLADRSVPSLSGGERQLVLLARALAQDAPVLLLDEPTAHLDLRHRLRVLDQLRAFATAGGSALVVSHDLGLAARGGDRLALLRAGRLHAIGSPGEVLTPEALRAVFGVEAQVWTAPDGGLAVLPQREAPP